MIQVVELWNESKTLLDGMGGGQPAALEAHAGEVGIYLHDGLHRLSQQDVYKRQTQPRGKHTIRVCLGTACYVRGGKKIVERLQELLDVKVGDTTADRKFTLEVARCIGACGLAPAMSIDDTVYKQVKPERLESILARYDENGGTEP